MPVSAKPRRHHVLSTDASTAQHLPLADHIVVLAESKVAEQGSWTQLRSSTGYVSQLQVKESSASSAQDAAIEKPTTVPGTTPPSGTDLMDLTRRTGDVSVYCTSQSLPQRVYSFDRLLM
jgi:hypothetical protein